MTDTRRPEPRRHITSLHAAGHVLHCTIVDVVAAYELVHNRPPTTIAVTSDQEQLLDCYGTVEGFGLMRDNKTYLGMRIEFDAHRFEVR
jgi:hypothetical protein